MAYPGHSSPMRGGEYYYSDMNSPSPTPSPHHYGQYYAPKTPTRPATRSHFRGASTGVDFRPATAMGSPRYNSLGEYATGAAPAKVSHTRKHSFSKGSPQPSSHRHSHTPKRERRHSHSHHRPQHGESDEDEYIEVDGVTYVLPASSRSRDPRRAFFYSVTPGYGTDHYYHTQVRHAEPPIRPHGYEQRTAEFRSPRYDDLPQRSATRVGHHSSSRPSTHTRRPSEAAVPKRPSTTKPTVQSSKKASAPAKATPADAERHRIPPGYSLKNWDPTEEPIMLLGSVFDCNSLGKWIYDWSVATYKAGAPLCNTAGELWLLLIELSGKMKRIEETVPRVRTVVNKDMLEDFIESGERLLDKLRSILKRCEEPMLKASKEKKSSQLPQNSGVEFINALLGKDRCLEKTERFMHGIRTWINRFDINCEPILKNPTM